VISKRGPEEKIVGIKINVKTETCLPPKNKTNIYQGGGKGPLLQEQLRRTIFQKDGPGTSNGLRKEKGIDEIVHEKRGGGRSG